MTIDTAAFGRLGANMTEDDSYERRAGGATAPFALLVPIGGQPAMAIRAVDANLCVHHIDEFDPFVSLALGTDQMALFVALSAQDLRTMGAAMLRSADLLDGGKGKQ